MPAPRPRESMEYVKKTLNLLLTTAFIYMGVGVLSGLFYREFTKLNGFENGAPGQLGLTHTHLLALGFFATLTFLVLEKQFVLSASRKLFAWFFWLYNSGVVLTAAMLLVHGCLQVLDIEASKAIPGIAGMGHILLTAGLIVLFFVIRAAIRRQSDVAATQNTGAVSV